MVNKEERMFLGLDLSSQQLKAGIVNNNLELICEESVVFDQDLPEYRTTGGMTLNKMKPNEITAPTIMWVKALDLLMDKLLMANIDFMKIAAISGTAQQHGSVYWQKGSDKILANLDAGKFLHTQLATSFTVPNSPTWMDSSTKKWCDKLETAAGGPMALAELTGSRAYERFTGAQIAKIAETKPDAYKNTERISLISSFLASLLLGQIAPIDYNESSGTNLLNLRTKKWDEKLLEASAKDLEVKLGQPVETSQVLGNISPYFIERYGFNPDCKIVAFTGDNGSSLIGLGLKKDNLAVSLGTSDTLFLWLCDPQPGLNGHILINPIDCNEYMALLGFKNGSLTRERIRNTYAEKSWDKFNELLESTPRGNFGYIGLYFDVEEIFLPVKGEYKYNKQGHKITKFQSPEIEIRAVVEGQFLCQRVFAEDMRFKIGANTIIVATGGASSNNSILQVLSDVFGSPVYVQDAVNSAMLGGAYNAKIGLAKIENEKIPDLNSSFKLVCEPYKNSDEIYEPLTRRMREILSQLR